MSDTLITPDAGSLSISGSAPVLGAGTVITPGVGSLQLTGISLTTNAAVIAFTAPLRSISSAGWIGITGSVDFDAPLRTIEAGNDQTSFTTPLREIAASGVIGATGRIAVNNLIRSISAQGRISIIGSANFGLLLRLISAAGSAGGAGTIAFTAPRRSISAVGYTGIVGSASFSNLLRTVDAAGYPTITGSISFVNPLRYLQASGFVSVSENYRGWVINLRTGSLVEYEGFDFNSMAKFGDYYIGAGPNGLFLLEGEDDDGEDIASVLRTGLPNFGNSFLKRAPRIYFSGSQDGDLFFTTISTEDGRRTYSLVDNGIRGEQQRRVPVGKGPKSVRWQFEVSNKDGADFGVSQLLVYPQVLRRRIL